MKRFYFFIYLSALCTSLYAQPASFEDLQLPEDSYWNGSDGSGSFVCGNITFYNDYNAAWASWNGFSYSNKTDVTTPGYANQYSAITGSGHNSENYAVGFISGTTKAELTTASTLSGFYLTNSTYTYLSMLNGDAYSKKFGGEKGIDPDYLKLTISGISETGETTGTVDFYLADFRFDNSFMDYIVNEWTWVDLSTLGEVKELRFSLESSDVGSWGMNTPAYFCLDDVNGEAPIDPLAGKTIATMEDIGLATDSYYDGSDMAGGFTSGGFQFKNNYNAEWFSWSGFAASTNTNTVTKGWSNQFSSIAGSGAQNTHSYAVGFDFGDMDVECSPQIIDGFYATNNAYTYWSIKEGDAYAKKFGGADGTDPDWLLLTIEGFDSLQNSTGTVDFYLADFRFTDDSKDYILKTWKYVDLSSLGEVSKLHFSLSSSDNGAWGMNSPAYFCLDELNYRDQAPIVINPVADIGYSENPIRVFSVPVEHIFTDPDDADSTMVYSIEGIDNPELVMATFVKLGKTEETLEQHIMVNITEGLTGEAVITLGATSNGKTTLHSFKIVVSFPTSIELVDKAVISVYPNPFANRLNISLPQGEGNVVLYDIQGRIHYEERFRNQTIMEINDLGFLSPGIYFINVVTQDGKTTEKIVKR